MFRGLGLQFIGIFILILFLQGYAFTILFGYQWVIGFASAFLTASLIMMADRAFLGHDYYLEGEYYYIKAANADDPRLAPLYRKRILHLSIRYAFGLTTSLAIVHFAEPGILASEVAQELHIRENVRNEQIFADAEIYRSGLMDEHNQLKTSIPALRAEMEALRAEISLIAGGNAAATRDLTLVAQITKLEEEAASSAKEAARLKRCASVEANGTSDPVCPEVVASGITGCREKCREWYDLANSEQQKSIAHRQSAAQLRKQLETLQSAADNVPSIRPTLEAQLAELANQLSSAQQRYAMISDDINNMVADWIADRKQLDDYDTSGRYGIVRVYNAVGFVKENIMEYNTTQTIIFLKIFIVFLETIVFTSRLLGSSQCYTVAMYSAYIEVVNQVRKR